MRARPVVHVSLLVLVATGCFDQASWQYFRQRLDAGATCEQLISIRNSAPDGSTDRASMNRDLQAIGCIPSTSARRAGPSEPDSAELRQDSIRRVRQDSIRRAQAAVRLANKWSYRTTTDEMTTRTARIATIRSENTINLDFPYEGAQRGTLTIRDHPSYGTDVILTIREGQFLCQSYGECRLRVRFDGGEARYWTANPPSDNSTTAVFISNYDGFVRQLMAADVVRLQMGIYQNGAPVFEFEVGGFDPDRYGGRVPAAPTGD